MTKQTTDRKRYVPGLGYHWLTPFYDWVAGIAGRGNLFLNTLIVQAQLENTQRVLDLACGTGTLAILIKQKFPEIDMVALDCDETMLFQAEQKANRASITVRFDQAFAEDLPYADHCFDRVVSSLFFHHLSWDSKKLAANEILRVLKPGGELHVLDWGPASNRVMRSLFFIVQMVDGFGNTQDNVSGRLIGLFDEAKFVQVRQVKSFNTIFGTLALYSAVKAHEGDCKNGLQYSA